MSAHLPSQAPPAPPATGGRKDKGPAAAVAPAAAADAKPVPRWVDSLLLAVDILAATPPKPPPAPAAPAGARLASTLEALQNRVQDLERVLGLQEGVAAPGEAAELARSGQAGGEAAAAPAAQQPQPAQPGGEPPSNATTAGQQQAAAAMAGSRADAAPSVTSPASGAGTAAAAQAQAQAEAATAAQDAQAAAGGAEAQAAIAPADPEQGQGREAGPPEAAAAAAGPQPSAEERVFGALAAAVHQYSTGGCLTAQEQQRTVDLCLRLLRHIQRRAWGADSGRRRIFCTWPYIRAWLNTGPAPMHA